MLKKLIPLAMALGLVLVWSGNAAAQENDGVDRIVVRDRAVATGDLESTPVDTEMLGVLRTRITKDGLNLRLRVSGNSSEIVAAHLHCAAPGEDGPVGLAIPDAAGFTDASGLVFRSTFTAPTPDNGCGWDDLADMTAAIIAGNVHLNVHTTDVPSGEIRADIDPNRLVVRDRAVATGDLEATPVDTDMRGVLRTRITKDGLNLRLRVSGNSSEIVAAHLHCAAPGENGPVGLSIPDAVGFTDASGQAFRSAFTAPDADNGCGWDDLADMTAAIIAGNVYLNVHTTDVPSGEIRANL